MPEPDSPWMTTEEAAAYAKYSAPAIREACRLDQLRHTQPGGRRGKLLTRRDWVDEWMLKHARGGEA